jgi:SAM-dependent methyltransferase
VTAAHDGYTERVAVGEAGHDAHLARYERAAARIPNGGALLDAGSGAGYGARLLASGVRAVTGVDLSPETVALAREAHGDLVAFQTANVLELPFADGSFDAVTCFEVIEHVPEPAVLVRELARVLRSGGLLFVSTPHARMERLHARRTGRGANPFHISSLTPGRLQQLLSREFSSVTLFGQAQDLGWKHAALQALDPFGFRLRIAPERRERMQTVLAGDGGANAPADSRVQFRFSRVLAHSAAITFAEAVK